MENPAGPNCEAEGADMLEDRTIMTQSRFQKLQAEMEALRKRAIPERREKVYFESTVQVRDIDRNESTEYTLVGPAELDPVRGWISSASPIGRALMGKAAGEIVTVHIPKGVLRLKVMGFR
jgi:transcription elongation GreA/GreB family factor